MYITPTNDQFGGKHGQALCECALLQQMFSLGVAMGKLYVNVHYSKRCSVWG